MNLLLPQLYHKLLPVSILKVQNLLTLVNKSIIPEIYKDEELKSSEDIPDTLAQTVEDDELQYQLVKSLNCLNQ